MTLGSWILIAAIVVIVGLIVIALKKQYRKVGPNEVLIVSGGAKRTVTDPDGTKRKIGYRIHIGGGTFVMPFIESAEVLPVEVFTIDMKLPEVLTEQGIAVETSGTAQARVRTDEPSVRLAAEQFLGTGISGMREISKQIIEGHMRSNIGNMTVKDLYRNRDEFGDKVEKGAQADLDRLGLEIISFSLTDITDAQGYIESLARPQIAKAKGDAAVAEAETEKEATIKSAIARKEGDIAKLKAETEVAEATRDYEAKRAEYQVVVNQKRANADVAYEIERQKMNQILKKEEAEGILLAKKKQVEIEDMEIKRREKELEATVKRPAEAESYRQEMEAKGRAVARKLEGSADVDILKAQGIAEAEAMKKKAESWSQYNQAAVYQMLIDALPDIAKSVSEPLSKVEKIVIVGGQDGSLGASRVTGEVAKILAQLPTIIESLGGGELKKLVSDLSARQKDGEDKSGQGE
ncbi:MAG: SPFH domain-containing protein [bacterium]|jgi:flotillin